VERYNWQPQGARKRPLLVLVSREEAQAAFGTQPKRDINLVTSQLRDCEAKLVQLIRTRAECHRNVRANLRKLLASDAASQPLWESVVNTARHTYHMVNETISTMEMVQHQLQSEIRGR
jgi:hypothetical protein